MGKKASIRLKELEGQKLKLNGRLGVLKEDQRQINRDIDVAVKKIRSIETEIESIKKNSTGVIISDHAIVRYVERVIGIDIDKIKQEICPESTMQNIKVLGNGTYGVNDNEFSIKVRDGTVVTLVKE